MYLVSFFLLFNCLSFSISKNIVLIITDDQDSVLDGMTPMTNTLNLIGDRGATFTNCFVVTPVCCPNRASILTGRYQHNHLTVNNSVTGGCNSARWQQLQEPTTFASLLQNIVGYKTFYAGKYLNQYGKKKTGGAAHVPLGWDWWAGLIGNSKYYNYSLSINGTERKYGDSSNDYLTDVIVIGSKSTKSCLISNYCIYGNRRQRIRRESGYKNNSPCAREGGACPPRRNCFLSKYFY
ncbi:PREDICTED: N-acetylglucosamine-6-sulfatase-like [Atta cephalotes]|uniref:Sulfatase N-terminal domain-containing protein n=1 Tax=Atta cephalotes TaxID=12957 RepID=A0A158NY37_ATTCE|nr:PREDICTED: N-acetylglucosamine-6-sulfatase-like [Atta cephalotes]